MCAYGNDDVGGSLCCIVVRACVRSTVKVCLFVSVCLRVWVISVCVSECVSVDDDMRMCLYLSVSV